MRDSDQPQPQASSAPPRCSTAPSPSMASRHSGPSGAEEGPSCSQSHSGSEACPSPPCSPHPETQGALTSGTPSSILLGKPEPGSSVKGAPSSPEDRNPVLPDKAEPTASKQTNPTSTAKGELGSIGKADPVPTDKTEPVIMDKEKSVVSGGTEPGTPKKEELGRMEKTDATEPNKGGTGPPEKQGPRNSSKEPPDCSREASAAAPGTQSGPPGEANPTAPEPAGTTETRGLGILTARVSDTSKGPSLGARNPGSSGKAAPQHPGGTETVTPTKEDPQLPGKRAPASSGTDSPVSVIVRPATSSEQAGPMVSGSTQPSVPGPAEPSMSVGTTEAVSSGKEGLGLSQKIDPISGGTTKAPASGNTNPETSGKAEPVSSSLGDQMFMGEQASLSPVKTSVDSAGRLGPLSPGKAALTSLGEVGHGTRGTADTSPSSPVSSTKGGPGLSGEPESRSEGQATPAPSGQAEALQKGPRALEKMDPGPLPSGQVGTEPLGKAGSPTTVKVSPLVLETAETSSRLASSKACGAAASLIEAERGTGHGGPEALPSTQVSSSQTSSAQASSIQPPSILAPSTQKGPAAVAGAAKSPGLGVTTAPPAGPRTRDNFTKAPSWDAGAPPPPREDAGTQAGAQASVSVALSPMSPQDGAGGGPAFSFQAATRAPAPAAGPPSRRDAGLQVSLGAAETRSVATGPMTPQAAPPVFPEVRVRPGSALAAALAPPEAAEPVRDVSWDDKGMTWEVYGAAMEVEVLGMAIQKHLERQIEEHGRQGAPPPPSSAASARPVPGRAGSVRAAPPDAGAKRPPGLFRALLQSVRRPRCCSRAGPTAE